MNSEKINREAWQELCLSLKNKAEKKGVTHQVIADATGYSKSNITRVLNEYYCPSIRVFLNIAKAIDTELFKSIQKLFNSMICLYCLA